MGGVEVQLGRERQQDSNVMALQAFISAMQRHGYASATQHNIDVAIVNVIINTVIIAVIDNIKIGGVDLGVRSAAL